MVGDVGFDPLGLTDIMPNLNYVREVLYIHLASYTRVLL